MPASRSRSRESMLKAKDKSVAEAIDDSSFEPEAPVKTVEELDQQPKTTPLCSCHLPGSDEPLVYESRTVRRSSRLALKRSMDLDVVAAEVKVSGRKRKCFSTGDKRDCIDFDLGSTEKNGCSGGGKGSSVVDGGKDVVRSQDHGDVGAMSSLSGVEEIAKEEHLELNFFGSSTDIRAIGSTGEKVLNFKKGKRKSDPDNEVELFESEHPVQSSTEKKLLALRSGKRVETTNMKINSGQSSKNGENNQKETGSGSSGWAGNTVAKYANSKQIEDGSFETTGKYNVIDDKSKKEAAKNVSPNSTLTLSKSYLEVEKADEITHAVGKQIQTRSTKRIDKGKEKLAIDQKGVDAKAGCMISTSTTGDKGKGKICNDDVNEEKAGTSTGSMISTSPIVPGNHLQDSDNPKRISGSSTSQNRGFRERFRNIAKQNASRFAHFPSLEKDNHASDVVEGEPPGVVNQETDDWPGPFSTAKRIIMDRQTKASMQQSSTLLKSDSTPIAWTPKKDRKSNIKKNLVPSLVDICLCSLAEFADAISSLDCVPDVLRHRLSDLLCDSRKIDEHFLGLLVHGTPTEIHVRECSWVTEEIFTKTFSGFDMSNLTVLQLDQCGASLPDYILSSTLAQSPNCLPSLTSLSLIGAYRLSNDGLNLIAASAPALRSINFSQCSLLTSDAIHSLASSFGPVLMELYIDDCQGIDAVIILPAFLQFKNLEVLSLTNIGSVSDDFINKFIPIRGHRIKELVLTNCINLTDSSVKIIAEYCPKLCAIDLSNLSKLTDSTLEYLANSCQSIHTLKFGRNGFSDEGVAAYLETRGEPIRELSLSNVNMVAHNTAISLARHSKNLHTLDLSWCRKLTDEAFGLIVDSCTTLKMLQMFGCTQITSVFLDGHSNTEVKIIGLKMTPLLRNLNLPEYLQGPLRHSFVT